MIKYTLLIITILVCAAIRTEAASDERPNFLFIVLDDLGSGQFQPIAETLTEGDFDPALVEFVSRQKGIRSYENDEALEAARKAMPTIAHLAEEGLSFRNAYAASALCSPARCGIMTGIHPNRLGVYNNIDVSRLPGAVKPEQILVPLLQDAGYATALIGKWHISPLNEVEAESILEKHGLPLDTYLHSIPKESPAGKELVESGFFGSSIPELHPNAVGFDYYYGYNFHQSKFYDDYNVWENDQHAGLQDGYNTETFTDRAIDFMKTASEKEEPFFVSLNYHAVHGPLFPKPPAEYMEPFEGLPVILQNFYGHVYAVDQSIRNILKYLERNDLLENTCIVFTSDNGGAVSRDNTLPGNAPHRGQKGQYLLGGVHVPMVVSWPERICKGRTDDELVSHLDLIPTALDAAGIEIPEGIDGQSMLPLIEGASKGSHESLVWFGLQSISWGFELEKSLVGEGVRNLEPGTWIVIDNDYVIRYVGTLAPGLYRDLPEGQAPQFELYDIKKDPGQIKNIYKSSPEIVARMTEIARQQAKDLPPPLHWRRGAWQELINSLKP